MEPMTPGYEVRCPRCDVSFPIGTGKCVHCGGGTVNPDDAVLLKSQILASTGTDEFPDAILALPEEEEREFGEPEEPASIGRTLMRSLGGFVWVIVLIGFTLARNCGGE